MFAHEGAKYVVKGGKSQVIKKYRNTIKLSNSGGTVISANTKLFSEGYFNE